MWLFTRSCCRLLISACAATSTPPGCDGVGISALRYWRDDDPPLPCRPRFLLAKPTAASFSASSDVPIVPMDVPAVEFDAPPPPVWPSPPSPPAPPPSSSPAALPANDRRERLVFLALASAAATGPSAAAAARFLAARLWHAEAGWRVWGGGRCAWGGGRVKKGREGGGAKRVVRRGLAKGGGFSWCVGSAQGARCTVHTRAVLLVEI